MKLYKFKSLLGDGLLHSLDMIVNERVYLACCDDMNDPEEGSWVADNIPIDDQYLMNAEKVRKIVDETRFTCFTNNFNNVLLWAHYAGGFSGICFEYEIDEASNKVLPISYSSKPALKEEVLDKLANAVISPQDVGILLTKAECWSYEKEYRLFSSSRSNSDYFSIKPQKVIFGARGLKYDNVFRQIAKKYEIPTAFLEIEIAECGLS